MGKLETVTTEEIRDDTNFVKFKNNSWVNTKKMVERLSAARDDDLTAPIDDCVLFGEVESIIRELGAKK